MTRGTSEPRAGRATTGGTSRKKSDGRRARGRNRKAIDATIAELERQNRLNPGDAARLEALRSIADALDVHPFNSQMWREYREGLEGLMVRGDDSSEHDAIIAKLRTPLRDASAS
jgi:hypothetical protein